MRDGTVRSVEHVVVRHCVDLDGQKSIWVGLPSLVQSCTVETDEFPWRDEAGIKASSAYNHVELFFSFCCLDAFLCELDDRRPADTCIRFLKSL